ncbi:MAG: dienelactone hydrolase, partial [Spirochaetota bacterium]
HGLGAFGEMADLSGLIAPRPLFVEAGDHDPIFPVEAVRRGLADARKVYSVFGAEDRVEHSIFEGRHRIDGEAAYAWLERMLGDDGGIGDEPAR